MVIPHTQLTILAKYQNTYMQFLKTYTFGISGVQQIDKSDKIIAFTS